MLFKYKRKKKISLTYHKSQTLDSVHGFHLIISWEEKKKVFHFQSDDQADNTSNRLFSKPPWIRRRTEQKMPTSVQPPFTWIIIFKYRNTKTFCYQWTHISIAHIHTYLYTHCKICNGQMDLYTKRARSLPIQTCIWNYMWKTYGLKTIRLRFSANMNKTFHVEYKRYLNKTDILCNRHKLCTYFS